MKIIVSSLSLFLFSFSLNAQPFNGGIMGGFTGSQVDGDSYAGFNKIGVTTGAFVNTRFSYLIGAQLELKYTGRGAFASTGSIDFPSYYQLNLHYVDFPLTARLYLASDFNVEAGIIFGYLFSRSIYDGNGKIPDNQISPDFNNADYDWTIGANWYVIPRLCINIRYAYSITPIRKRTTGNYYYSFLARMIGYTEGDYNNYVTIAAYFQLNQPFK